MKSILISPELPPRDCDVAIVGGGIVGLSVAREVLRRRPIARVCVLEAEDRLALHQTGHSSGVVHAGVYYEPGSLKASLCVRGAKLLATFCERHGIPLVRNGKLIVATDQQELERLDDLERRGEANSVPGLTRVDAAEIRQIEPNAAGIAGLHSPNTGVVDFAEVARACAREVSAAGGTIHTRAPVLGSNAEQGRITLEHAHGISRASAAIFCAGIWSDRLAIDAGAPDDPHIVPFRGSYLRLIPEKIDLVRGNLYPVPDPALPFLGVHVTHHPGPAAQDGSTGAGTTLIGPTALMAPARDAYRLTRIRPREVIESLRWPGTRRLGRQHWRAAATELRHAASRKAVVKDAARLVPALRASDTVRGPAGIRAQALAADGSLIDDFVVHVTERAIHVRNAPSPAATSSLALAERIVDQLEDLD